MDTIIIKSNKKSISDLFLEMARQIRVKAKILTEDEMEDLRLNKMLLKDEKNLQEVPEEIMYQSLRKHGAKI
jgi:chromosome condensin MukBEF complex kleisin-like MukF subunit